MRATDCRSTAPHNAVVQRDRPQRRKQNMALKVAVVGLRGIGTTHAQSYSKDELSGRYTGLARLIYWRKVAGHGLSALKIPVYVGASYEVGNAWQKSADIGFDSIISAGSVFIGADTYIGPLYFAYGFAECGHNALYLYLGRTF